MSTQHDTLRTALTSAHRPLILDGAMGTMIQAYGLTETEFRGQLDLHGQQAGNNDLLCLTRPDIIQDIHRRYLAAGADILETNTFNAQRISLADYNCQHLVRDINLAAVHLARQAVNSYSLLEESSTPSASLSGEARIRAISESTPYPHFIVGSVGPTNKALSMSPDVTDPARRSITFDEMAEAYEEQMTALMEGGVDALLIETIFDTLNAKAAIFAAEAAMQAVGTRLPLMLSVTVSDSAGRTLSGQTLEAFLVSILHAAPLSVGLNCSFGAEDMLPHLRHLRQFIDSNNLPLFISAYPNAGLPNQLGQYEETPQLFAAHLRPFIEEGLVNILGGCCGTTDAHIRAIHSLLPACQSGDCSPISVSQSADPSPLPTSQSADPSQLPTSQSAAPSQLSDGWLGEARIRAVSVPAIPAPSHPLSLSGLEPLFLTPEVGFINVGERCNVAGSRKFLRLIKEKNYDEALSIARQQVEDGAMVLDINLDDGLLDTRTEMCHFLNLLAAEPEICRVPFMIDSSNWDVIRAALRCIQGKAIVNSISLKEGEEAFLSHAREIRRLGAAVIVMAFDEEGQATTYERRIAVCQRAYRLLTEQAAFPPEDIIFDSNILSIATGMAEHDRYALDFIRATEWIKQNLPGAHVSGGVSNLSFSFRGNNYLREAMHAVFLYHARRAGMDMAIVNPATRVTYSDLPADQLEIIEDAILARRADAAERLTELASTCSPDSPPVDSPRGESTGEESVDTRLIAALRHGTTEHLEADLTEALNSYPRAVDIIEGPLMKGMNIVGQLFGEGKMFLPQVIKTARTMKRAVEILQPAIEAQKIVTSTSPSNKRPPRVLVATVKGDVHDIGKNIVSVVMACNGYEIIDLGVMVPAEVIVQKALGLQPDVIGLSGLITPSLEEMVNTVRQLDAAGVHVPVLIGGATTSRLHTALKIAPVYSGPVIHVKDASQNAPLAAQFLNPDTAASALTTLQTEQAALREQAQPTASLSSLDEARRQKPHLDFPI